MLDVQFKNFHSHKAWLIMRTCFAKRLCWRQLPSNYWVIKTAVCVKELGLWCYWWFILYTSHSHITVRAIVAAKFMAWVIYNISNNESRKLLSCLYHISLSGAFLIFFQVWRAKCCLMLTDCPLNGSQVQLCFRKTKQHSFLHHWKLGHAQNIKLLSPQHLKCGVIHQSWA